MLSVEVQSATRSPGLPDVAVISNWAGAAFRDDSDTGVCIRLVDEEEIAVLNQTYRERAGPTNVLSFPADIDPRVGEEFLGDIVICGPVVQREAIAQNKTLTQHFAHMVVHGMLHLQGYDHIEASQAVEMESLERDILAGLGFPDPYES